MKRKKILITGSCGLIGSALKLSSLSEEFSIRGLDIHGVDDECGDVRDYQMVKKAVSGCDGVIHLAAVSRVVYGEENPSLCVDVNINGLQNVLHAIAAQKVQPWLIFASSREVYGDADDLPVTEDCLSKPLNIYGQTKVRSELMVHKAIQETGLNAAILRFSNVYGGVNDYRDRVVPAFIHAAINNKTLRVDGEQNTFDFTYIDDVVSGVRMTVERLSRGDLFPMPIQFVSGKATTLKELALKIIRMTGSSSSMIEAPPRDFDVVRFFGSYRKAMEVLGWKPLVSLDEGLKRLSASIRTNFYSPIHSQKG